MEPTDPHDSGQGGPWSRAQEGAWWGGWFAQTMVMPKGTAQNLHMQELGLQNLHK